MRAITLTSLFRQKMITKPLAIVLLFAFVSELLFPVAAFAIGGGPSQPEATGFKPATASDMVDPFSGDFSYNIPLLDVDGYPVNLAYNSGITMEQEASWVGLGWVLNVGALNRSMRGIPDDFSGDKITKEVNLKNNHTFGVNVALSAELIGSSALQGLKLQPKLGLGVDWNSYSGTGVDFSMDASLSGGRVGDFSGTVNLGIKSSSSAGVSGNANVGLSKSSSEKMADGSTSNTNYNLSLGFPFNSSTGFSEMTVGLTATRDIYKPNDWRSKSSSSISFGYPFRIPQTRMNMFNTNFSANASVGLEIYGLNTRSSVRSYYAGQFLVDKTKNIPSYGFLNTEQGQGNEEAMLDFNREKEGSYSEFTPRLPVTHYTYDVLSASGQGMSGTYRPYRNDVGVMRDDVVRSYSAGLDLPGMEIGALGTAKVGTDFHLNATDVYSGRWRNDNDAYDHIKSVAQQDGTYEPYYYKKLGEKTSDDNEDFLHTIGYHIPVRINLTDKTQEARNELEDKGGVSQTLSGELKKNVTSRAKRNEPLFGLKAEEASLALDEKVRSYNFVSATDANAVSKNIFESSAYTDISRLARPAHHMTEYTAVSTSGARYVYGIPAYNTLHQDVTFAVADQHDDCSYRDLVTYSGTDDSKANTNGIDNYYERMSTPAYAHSYLLTAVLSDDYTDRTGNGPSDDDKGTYTKFNYSRLEGFKWRSPYSDVFYNPGIGANKQDDKGSYTYGEKELWYLHSIETKNYVAVFITDDRNDGYSAAGKQGGRGTLKSKLLKRIELYVKSDLLNNPNKPIPVKVVHFDYNYSLCKGVPSNAAGSGPASGKLTLSGVHFTYGNSTRAASRGYTFAYTVNEVTGDFQNPDYSNKSYDRWGTFKHVSGLVSNADLPYAEQSKTLADKYARAWNLKMINLPSGGTITVDYEADDYGFVQNLKAMRMFTLLGSSIARKDDPVSTMTRTWAENVISTPACGPDVKRKEAMLYEASTPFNAGVECAPYQYFYLKVNEPVADKNELRHKYFTDETGTEMKELYYRFFVKTEEGDNRAPSNYEAVPGYISQPDMDYGVCDYQKNGEGKTQYIWIRLKPVNIGDYVPTGNASPISRSAWSLLRARYPRIGQARADFDPDKFNVLAVFQELASSIYQLYQTFTGYFFSLRQRNLCRAFDCEKSVFRLYSPDMKKAGGGSRVKRITLNDRFSSITSQSTLYTNAEYGKEYTYTTPYQGREISSGVAAYEPMMGGEESPFRQPLVKKKDQNFMAIGTNYLQEGCFGESFFPASSVGYRKVTVKSIKKGNARSTATGKEELEFYTHYDFPNLVDATAVEVFRDKPDFLTKLFKCYSFDHLATSQGYAVELNDMSGKQKAVKSYSEFADSVPISSTEYFYKRDTSDLRKLDNFMTTIDSRGNINRNVRVGVETDIVADMREDNVRTHGGELAGNLDAFIAFVPVAIPFLLPKYTQENVSFRSAVVTKVINRSGLLDSVVVKDLGARKVTQNLAIDAESGEVLVTRVNNNFNDDVYQVNQPAYWMYSEMAHAYKRTGAKYQLSDVLGNPSAYLLPGDEVAFGNYYGWVTNVSPSLGILSNTGVYYNIREIMDEEDVTEIKIARPVNHNKIMLPASSAVVKENPLKGSQVAFAGVVDANAKYYDDNWKIFCGCANTVGNGYNPYVAGRKGNFRLVKDYVFLSGRTQTKYNRNLNVRKDGLYTSFTPFWNYNNVWTADSPSWTYSGENTLFSATGAQLESRDALNRYSAAQFAFSDRANTAIGQNAMYREIGFDSFEDYLFLSAATCQEAHFSFYSSYSYGADGGVVGTRSALELSPDSHSGNYALKIRNQNNYIKIRKVISPCK